MKRILNLLICTSAAFALASCDLSDIIGGMDKTRNFAYIRNSTELDVEIRYSIYSNPMSINVKAGEEIEIPDTDRWGLVQNPEDVGEVRLAFNDGSTWTHHCTADDNNEPVFSPSSNNIMDEQSWERSKISGNKYRNTYTIR